MTPWQRYEIPANATRYWQLGPLELWLADDDGEWCLATRRKAEREDGVTVCEAREKPPELPWQRWVAPAAARAVNLMPLLPDLPLVVRPEEPIALPPKARGLFYASLPLSVGVELAGGPRLLTVPSVAMSKTWFGEPDRGELCYTLRSLLRRSLAELPAHPGRLICPLTIENEADSTLPFLRLVLQVANLAVFQDQQERLWTNAVTMKYRGSHFGSVVTVSERAPVAEARQLSAPRVVVRQSMIEACFDHLVGKSG